MNNQNEIRELNVTELNLVSGGVFPWAAYWTAVGVVAVISYSMGADNARRENRRNSR